MQPCPPWTSNLAGNPSQNASSPGYGRSWLGVTCAEWNGAASSTSTLLGGASSLSLTRLGMVGNLSTALCELFPSLTMLDVSQNALSGTLLPCFGTQGTTLSGRFTLSVFDNNFVGTVPQSYTALSWMAISYNPGLYGALPAGLAALKIAAWSGNLNRRVHMPRVRSECRQTDAPSASSLVGPTAATTRTI